MNPFTCSRLRRASLLAVLGLAASLVAQAASITGTVTNKTTNKPSAGDDVVLIAFGQGMQEAARTKTDADGHFTLDIPDNGMHLVRVDHEREIHPPLWLWPHGRYPQASLGDEADGGFLVEFAVER